MKRCKTLAADSTFKPPPLPELVCIVDLGVGPHRPIAGLGSARPGQ